MGGTYDPAGDPRQMQGGAKAKWLRANRARVLDALARDGFYRTGSEFGVTDQTLVRFCFESSLQLGITGALEPSLGYSREFCRAVEGLR